MKVVVLGAGALGGLIGGLLASTNDVTLVARQPVVEAIGARGLSITGETQRTVRPRAVSRADEAPGADLVVVTTKAYDTHAALAEAAPILAQRPLVLSLQNGLTNASALVAAVGVERAVLGVTTHGATLVEPGHIHHAGAGYTRIGTYGNPDGARLVAEVLSKSGLDTTVTDNVEGELWAKAVVNAGINPLTAITGLRNGALLEERMLQATMEAACQEAIAVARAERIRLPDDDLVARTREVARRTAGNKSSMLQDVERGRRTEVDAITGEIVARAAAHGIAVPVSRTLLALVHGIERTTRLD